MEILLDFTPDLVIYANFHKDQHYFDGVWGDKNILDCGKDYIRTLLPKESCFFFCKKGLGKYKIILGKVY